MSYQRNVTVKSGALTAVLRVEVDPSENEFEIKQIFVGNSDVDLLPKTDKPTLDGLKELAEEVLIRDGDIDAPPVEGDDDEGDDDDDSDTELYHMDEDDALEWLKNNESFDSPEKALALINLYSWTNSEVRNNLTQEHSSGVFDMDGREYLVLDEDQKNKYEQSVYDKLYNEVSTEFEEFISDKEDDIKDSVGTDVLPLQHYDKEWLFDDTYYVSSHGDMYVYKLKD
jgi:hypothetical protein